MIEAGKSIPVGLLYFVCLLVGVGLIFAGYAQLYWLIIGIAISLVSLIILIDYIKIPMTPFYINSDDKLVLPKNIVLSMSDILDVSYRRASARGLQYRWGTITVYSTRGTYKYRYISECETVAKCILKLVCEKKKN